MLTNCVQILHTDHEKPENSYRVERVTCRGIVVNEGKILISHETVDDTLLIPGGGMEDGETPEECCRREVFEETGYHIIPRRNFADVHMYFGSSSKFINHFFVCDIVSQGKPQLMDYEEELGLIPDWFELKEAYGIFADYKKYKDVNHEKYVLYQREFLALDSYLKQM